MNSFEEFMIGFKARHPDIYGTAQDAILAPEPRRIGIAPVKPVTARVAPIPVVSVPLKEVEEEWDGEEPESVVVEEKPEEYRDLVVRIAGFSAYFVELSTELQNDIIARMEFGQI